MFMMINCRRLFFGSNFDAAQCVYRPTWPTWLTKAFTYKKMLFRKTSNPAPVRLVWPLDNAHLEIFLSNYYYACYGTDKNTLYYCITNNYNISLLDRFTCALITLQTIRWHIARDARRNRTFDLDGSSTISITGNSNDGTFIQLS